MNQEQKQAKLNEKVQAIQTLLVSLKIGIFGKQKMTRDGYIENVIVYQDLEEYSEPEINPTEDEKNA